MKIKTVDFGDKVIGAESEQAFSIDADNHVIFDILRSKMYSDPIASICREVICNSRDANREVGSGDVPVSVSINEAGFLDISGSSVSFSDSGPGISPERMSDIFLKYGASTKRGTNGQTGGFGLGAKTPFAYSDTFTVVTVCMVDGKKIKYIYTAMLDSTGKGKMVLMNSEETSDPKGTEIIVPIRSAEDQRAFEQGVIAATQFWLIKPLLTNFSKEPLDYTVVREANIDDNEYRVIELADYSEVPKWVALIDGIPYPIRHRDIDTSNSTSDLLNVDISIQISFENGDLTVSANRENLQYDDDTIDTLSRAVVGVRKDLAKYATESITSAPTYFKACINRASISSNNISSLWSDMSEEAKLVHIGMKYQPNNELEWKGEKVRLLISVPGVYIELASRHNGKTVYKKTHQITSKWENMPIILKDIKVKDNKRNATLFQENTEFLIVTTSPVLDTEDAKEQTAFLEDWGLGLIKYSSIVRDESGAYTSQQTYYKQKRDVEVMCWSTAKEHTTITYNKDDKSFERDIIIARTGSMNWDKYGTPYTTTRRASAAARLLGREVVIMNDRSIELYASKTEHDFLNQVIEELTSSDKFKAQIEDAALQQVSSVLYELVDQALLKHFNVTSPMVRRVVKLAENANPSTSHRSIINDLGLDIDKIKTGFNFDKAKDSIRDLYSEWRKEYWIIDSAFEDISYGVKRKHAHKLLQLKDLKTVYNLLKKQKSGSNKKKA